MTNAYVWLLVRDDSYFPGIITSIYSTYLTSTPHEFVLMISDHITLNDHQLALLNSLDVRIIPVKELSPIYATKLHIYNLTDYEKIIFLDADTIVLRSIDHLFDNLPIDKLLTPRNPFFHSTIPIASLLVMSPSVETYNRLIASFPKYTVYPNTDELTLLDCISDISYLPLSYCFDPNFPLQEYPFILHFTKIKPWNLNELNIDPGKKRTFYRDTYYNNSALNLWRQLYKFVTKQI